MKNKIKVILFLVVVSFYACSDSAYNNSKHRSIDSKKSIESHQHEFHKEKKNKKLYTCPMHPQIVQDKPGTCPICGMDLVLKKSDKNTIENYTNKHTILIDPVVVQNMGIRVDKVKKGTISRQIRTYGRVEIPDDQKTVVNLKYSGWVEKIWVNRIGDFVKKGERLFSIYSPQIYAAEKEYVMALQNYDMDSKITKSAKERLVLWSIPLWIINKIEKEKKAMRFIPVTAPTSGFIYKKSVVKGSRVRKGTDLYTIYNMQKVWIKAEIYESDISWIKKSDRVSVKFIDGKQKDINSKISYIYPVLNKKSQTITIRVEVKNKKRTIKSGMLAIVTIYSDKRYKKVIIPTEAIIDTGNKKIVFISKKLGQYEARDVKTGLVGDNFTEITDGISEGETVVLSGQFLLDSESQLKEAVDKFLKDKLQKR